MNSTRSLIITIIALAGVAFAGAVAMVYVVGTPGGAQTGAEAQPPTTDPATGVSTNQNLYADFYIPEFNLTDQDGNPIDESVLEGKVSVVDFFFTTCPLACPGMNAQMQRVQEATQGTGVRLLSISVSGEYDTPDVLTAYAERVAADPERWRFLTGDPRYVARLVFDGLRFNVSEDDSVQIPLPDGSSMFNIQHPTKLLLIGPDRHVLGMASYQSPDEVAALIEQAKRAAGG